MKVMSISSSILLCYLEPSAPDSEGSHGKRGPMRNGVNIRWVIYLAFILATICPSQEITTASSAIRGQIEVEGVLAWLPSDTETLLVVNSPFRMSHLASDPHNYEDHKVTTEELERYFEDLILGFFGSGKGLLEKHLEGKKVLFALEGSRRFRSPTSLGELLFEGATIAVFEDDLDDRRDAFMKDAANIAASIEQIEGQKVLVLKEPSEQDVWTIFITFPQKNVVVVATNEGFLRETLARMSGAEGKRALPESLPEWKYVNERAPFWGLRHYDKQQSRYDPTSPFGGKKTANFPDEEAIGLSYQCDPKTERRVTITYLTGARDEARKIAENRFLDEGEPEQMARLNIQHRELEPGVIQSTFVLTHSQPANLFFFTFIMQLGHAVYV
jgi:hypothetical protein